MNNKFELKELGTIFNTKTKRKIIQILIANPEREWYGKELADMIGVTPASVYMQIGDLVKSGIVIEKSKGRMRFFRINTNHWFVRNLFPSIDIKK